MKESPDELEQYDFDQKQIWLTPIAMVVSAASSRYVMKIMLDLIKAYDLFQKYQFMDIVDEESSVETSGVVASLLQSSAVMTAGYKTKLTKMRNVGLKRSVSASPAMC